MPTATTRLLTVPQAAARLTVSASTVRRLLVSGRLPAIRPSPGTVRLRESDLDELIAGGRHEEAAR